ncbi:hypothetical protein AK812_SmicGene31170 [Symbiodinium microadriaticum]|uniref:Uncharacterized protein n=1 Tax=Symbiodinium microadriaticum TaxID=2951 RepID=A0A1Q9CXD8_SYMMI|nr:hypothetical protein AK812_SmicGene31170 [Symbiodinium microadriaticum]CAE7891314.1 unnamed protein product [Symbiodinium microadriaticum]
MAAVDSLTQQVRLGPASLPMLVLMRKEGKAFASDINGADAMRTPEAEPYNAVLAAIDLFTTKQQRHLQADTYFLRKLHRQEQEKQERLAREAKARAHEAKKAAKAAKENPQIEQSMPEMNGLSGKTVFAAIGIAFAIC